MCATAKVGILGKMLVMLRAAVPVLLGLTTYAVLVVPVI
jgi:hypothetical protein